MISQRQNMLRRTLEAGMNMTSYKMKVKYGLQNMWDNLGKFKYTDQELDIVESQIEVVRETWEKRQREKKNAKG